jgi:hypothetical protein
MIHNNLLFFKVCKNKKQPIKNEKYGDITKLKPLNKINTNLYNVGISAGPNNLIILDIDTKDEGLIEWTQYKDKFGEPLTVCEKTPNSGYHYYFKHRSTNYTSEQIELIEKLKNKSKYRNGKGIDIRINNGYCVCEPSTIDDKKYEFIRHYNHYEILEMPLSLLEWLLEFENESIKNSFNNDLVIINDVIQLKELLKNFNNENSKEWFKITACIKNLLHPYNKLNKDELMRIWDEWSQGTEKYNKVNNYKIWENLNLNINFNYLICILNTKTTTKIKLLESIKHYEPITKDISNIKQLRMNNKYIFDKNYSDIQLTKELFNDNDTIIIESTTGTGKTSNTSNFIKQYIDENDENYKVLSIVSRKTLGEQHIESFKNINMISYEDNTKDIDDDNITICINSLLMYSRYTPSFFNNYIVYIDEISTFTRHLTHNNTLDKNLKLIYTTLMKIINNCKKLILTEALINDNVFNITEKRPNETKIFIKNTFQKYKGVKTIQYNDENKFLELIISKIKNGQYFLFGCDSCNIITTYYSECIKYSSNCILITADEKFKINNVNEQFKNKFVFYSPSITCGIDFSIIEPQDVILYIKGNTLEPCDSFQQLTRTRNIKTVHFYINEKTIFNNAEYKHIDECNEHFKNIASIHSTLSNLCITINEDDELKFNDNTFFKLFIYNEYLNDIYNTNKERHFKQILLNNGFNISCVNIKQELKKETKLKLKQVKDELQQKIFIEHIDEIKINETLEDKISFLKITSNEDKLKYYDVINDKFIKDSYLNLIRLFQTDESILNKLNSINKNSVDYKAIYSTYNKINLLRQLEKELNIETFEINKINEDKPIKINNELITKINTAFRTDQTPESFNEFIEYYISKLKHLTGNIEIIKGIKKQVNKKRGIHYSIINENLKFYFDLHYLSNPTRYNIKPSLLEKFKTEIKIMTDEEFNKVDDNNEEKDEEPIKGPLD